MSTEEERKEAYRRCAAILAAHMRVDNDAAIEEPGVWEAMASVRDTLALAGQTPPIFDTQEKAP